MYCHSCGKEIGNVSYCPHCGAPQGRSDYRDGPKKSADSVTLMPFILGFLLSAVGVVVAVIIFNGDRDDYDRDPTARALAVSLIGMFCQIPVLFFLWILLVAMMH